MKKISWDSMVEPLSDEQRIWNRKIQECRSEAIAYLGLSKKPTGQVAGRLRDEGFEEDLIKEVIRELTDEGYLDDVALARKIAAQRRGRQSESREALRLRLLSRGLDADAVDKAVAETEADHERIDDLLTSRFQDELDAIRQPGLSAEEKRRLLVRIARLLSSRGFAQELINQFLGRHR